MVLFNYDTNYMTSLYTDNEEDRNLLESIVFDRLYWDQLDRGEIGDSEMIAMIRQSVPKRLVETAEKIYDNWIRNLTPISGMTQILRTIKTMEGSCICSPISVSALLKNTGTSRLYAACYLSLTALFFPGRFTWRSPIRKYFVFCWKNINYLQKKPYLSTIIQRILKPHSS